MKEKNLPKKSVQNMIGLGLGSGVVAMRMDRSKWEEGGE